MTRVLVLGANGMLGGMVVASLLEDPGLEIAATARDDTLLLPWSERRPSSEHRFDAEVDDIGALLAEAKPEWVVNAIGKIKPYIRDDDPDQRRSAVAVNADFPYALARAARANGARVVQIATDCVYSGSRGEYRESAAHDALDVYGKTKSLGEVPDPVLLHLRCSIIGPETKARVSLLDWFLSQPPGAGLKGFTNHRWNGVTTLHFGRLCRGIANAGLDLPGLLHVVPGDIVTKDRLLELFAAAFGREDVSIEPVEAPVAVDRSLDTDYPDLNAALWRAAGYEQPPTIETMVRELAAVAVVSRPPTR